MSTNFVGFGSDFFRVCVSILFPEKFDIGAADGDFDKSSNNLSSKSFLRPVVSRPRAVSSFLRSTTFICLASVRVSDELDLVDDMFNTMVWGLALQHAAPGFVAPRCWRWKYVKCSRALCDGVQNDRVFKFRRCTVGANACVMDLHSDTIIMTRRYCIAFDTRVVSLIDTSEQEEYNQYSVWRRRS